MNKIAVIDGNCALCTRIAQMINRYDPSGEIKIAPIQHIAQGSYAAAFMSHQGLDPLDPTSWLFIENGIVFKEMDAVLVLCKHLTLPIGLGYLVAGLRIFPAVLRNMLYRCLARQRYYLFGPADLCAIPDLADGARLRARIVDLTEKHCKGVKNKAIVVSKHHKNL